MTIDFTRLRQIEHHIDSTIRLYPNEQPDDYPPHWHNAYEVIMPVENRYTVIVGEVDHVLNPGEIIVIPAGVVHEIFAPDQGMRFLFLIDQEEISAIEGMALNRQVFFPCVHLTEDSAALAEARLHLERAVREYSGKDEFGAAAARMELGLMFVGLARHLIQLQRAMPMETRRQHTEQSFLSVCHYISSHCAEALTLDQVAAYTGYSKCHFSRMFKSYTGMSFYDYFLKQRVLKCKQFLSDPDLSVTEAALRAGFGSIATFNRVFRQQEGMTPSEYRALRQTYPAGHKPGDDRKI